MKKLNGTKIRDKENLQKSTLYSVPTAMKLKLEEVHVDDPAKDIVNVDFQLKENEYGVYGNEYRPLYLTKGSCKVLDLLCVLVNDEEKRMASYLFDVKSKTGGKDEIPDFLERKVTIHGREYELEVHMLQPFENDFVIDFPVKL